MSSLFLVFLLYSLWLCSSQIPPADKCQFVNDTEPAECPDHIGPPCPPCITNEQPDYVKGDTLTLTASESNSLEFYMNRNIDYWIANYPPNKVYPTNDPSDIYQGSAGRAQIFLRLYIHSKNETQLGLVYGYIENALHNINSANKQISYMEGNVGIYTISSLFYHTIGDTNNANLYMQSALDIFNDVNTAIINGDNTSPKYRFDMQNCPFFTGIAGLLYNAIFLNEYHKPNVIVNESVTTNIVHHLLDYGIETGAKFGNNYMMFEDGFLKGCYLVGAGEGVGGVLRMVLDAYYHGYVTDIFEINKYADAISNTLQYLLSIQYSDGNMPTYLNSVCAEQYGDDNDARVQWCHGAPSFQETFSKAALVYAKLDNMTFTQTLLDAGLSAYNATWERGLLIKGLMQCHGIGGNVFTMLDLFQNLQFIYDLNDPVLNDKYDFEYLINQSAWRAKQIILWTLDDYNLDHTRTNYSNADFSMWWSSYAVPLLYVRVLQDKWPFVPVCMPVWDYCI